MSAIPAVGLDNTPSIWYNSHKQTVKLQGPAGVIEQARTRLETVLKDIYCCASLQHILRPTSKCFNISAKHSSSASKVSATRKSDPKPSEHIFDLRPDGEDGNLAAVWTKNISPVLHSILSPRLGQNYAASLVRQGPSEASARAYIRIQSECRQSQSIRAEIRKEINAICDAVGQCHVSFRFSVGKLVLLGKFSSAGSSDDEGCENDNTDLCDFPWFKRYWKTPGMGASLGLRCSNSVSATLGGYVFVNNRPYLLTVDHFIDKAQEHRGGATAAMLDPWALTSPSLLDMKDMTASLEQSIRNTKADIARYVSNLGPEDLLVSDMKKLYDTGGDLRQVYDMLGFFHTLLNELKKDEQEFILGRVAHRCTLKAREPSSYCTNSLPQAGEYPVEHRMDWTLCEVRVARCGINRHRFRFDDNDMDHMRQDAEPHGLGELCQDTCDVEPGRRVYFVGQKTGINHGRIGSSLINCRVNGIPTREWSIIVRHPVSDGNDFAGDSGAWILRESDHSVVGQLWGYEDGLLLFTPINVIFADIMDSLGTKNVGLQNRYLNPDASAIYTDITMKDSVALICEHKESKQRKPKGYKYPLRTTFIPRKTSSIVGPSPEILLAISLSRIVLPNDSVVADIVPGSPVPSFASSFSSSTAPEPQTPKDSHDTKTEHHLLSSSVIWPQLTNHHVKISPNEIEDNEVIANDERVSPICTIQAPHDRPIEDVADKTSKHSLRFILRDLETDLNCGKIQMPDMYPFTGFRKSQSFPTYHKPLKPQSQASITALG